ncbi:cation channel sperm-associated protein subunit delta-domain-containing protein [Zopfochytrium polystomum]|nr:cation channel sperm-associated protein subunit delta-domain-containing protein [Zopfochytrium polystomum]
MAKSFGHGSFFYQSLEQDGVSFYANRPFLASYTSASTSVSWVVSSNCAVSNLGSSQTVQITCSQIGVEAISVSRNGDATTSDTFYVTIAKSPGCYQWVLATGPPGWELTSSSQMIVPVGVNLTGRLWIADPSRGVSLADTTTYPVKPSSISSQLTYSFMTIGEAPNVTSISDALSIQKVLFNQDGRYWDVLFNLARPGTVPVVVSGQGAALIGCTVLQTWIPLAAQDNTSSIIQQKLSSSTTSSSAQASFSVTINRCATNNAFATSSLFGDGRVAVSQTFFTQPQETKLKAFQSITGSISNIAATRYSLLVVVNNQDAYIVTNSSGPAKVAALSSVNQIRATTFCKPNDLWPPTLADSVLAWSSKAGSSLFYSQDGGLSFSSVSLSGVISTSGFIRDALVQKTSSEYLILARNGDKADVLIGFNPQYQSLKLKYVFVGTDANAPIVDANSKGSVPGLIASTNGGDIFIYGDGLFISPDSGQTVFTISLKSRNPSLPAVNLAATEYVVQVASSSKGHFAALTSTRRVFIGHSTFSEAIEVVSGLVSTDLVWLEFDAFDRLVALIPTSTPNLVSKRIIPFRNELVSPRAPTANNPTLVCPYALWTHSLPSESAVDIGENLTFSATLQPFAGNSNRVIISVSNNSLVSLSANQSETFSVDPYLAGSGLWARQVQAAVVPIDYAHSGRLILRARPRDSSLACDAIEGVSLLSVGCPSTRRVVFRDGRAMQPNPGDVLVPPNCSSAPTEVSFGAGNWVSDFSSWTRPHYTKVVPYDCGTYGVPVSSFYGEFFTPALDVYDGDVFVKTVDADFALWEVNGQGGFDYNITNEKAGCMTSPQTWEQMVRSSSSGDPRLAWGPSNYQPCYTNSVANISKGTAQSAYTIFNGTNNLGIVWKSGEDATYQFYAVVLDPSFSYCTLSTSFAVRVEGTPIPVGVQVGIVLGCICAILSVLGLSYMWFLRNRQLEAKEKAEVDEREREEAEREMLPEEMVQLWKQKYE